MMLPNLVKQLLVATLTISVSDLVCSEPMLSLESSTSTQKNVAALDAIKIEISSLNTQRVGLIGEDVSATISYTKNRTQSKSKKVVLVKFSVNVLVNAYGRKGCRSSSCLMEVRFDNGEAINFKLYESDNDYLKTVLIKDSDFAEKITRAKTIAIKMRFADYTDGTFIFKK